MSNEEKRDIEDKINDAMAKIVSDTAGEKIRCICFSKVSPAFEVSKTFQVGKTEEDHICAD